MATSAKPRQFLIRAKHSARADRQKGSSLMQFRCLSGSNLSRTIDTFKCKAAYAYYAQLSDDDGRIWPWIACCWLFHVELYRSEIEHICTMAHL